MKADLINEVTDRVMDKLGGIEGDYFKEYSSNPYFADKEKDEGFSEDFDSEPDAGAIEGDFEPEDDDIFFDDEEDY